MSRLKKVTIPKTEDFKKFSLKIKKRSKFLVDENLGYLVNQVLNELGWNSKFVAEVGLNGRADNEVFQYAYRKKRIILTHDEDFLNNRNFPYYNNPGVIILPGAKGSSSVLERAIADMIITIAPFYDVYHKAKIIFYPDREIKIMSLSHKGLNINRYKWIGKNLFILQ